jgi:hypothetical protein
MKINDDYLWDKTGEPDAEVEHLEELLGRYRHESKAPELPVTSRRIFLPRLAVAAAVILMALAGAWLVLNRQSDVNTVEQTATGRGEATKEQEPKQAANGSDNQNHQPKQEVNAPPTKSQRPVLASANRNERGRKPASANRNLEAQKFSATVAAADFETANYLESAQMLLRSFRNIAASEGEVDLSYEKERSRELLYRNIVLRRNAEAKGDLPITGLLGSLEPILLDIANLPDDSSQADVRSIQERIQKKEIVATLQVYSAPVLSQAFRQR